jgi:hypothetical protein
LKILEVHLKFKAPLANNTEEWPNLIKAERKGELIALFNNGDIQRLILDVFLLRPML